MSQLFYNISVYLYYFLIWGAGFFNQKARKFIDGRKGLLESIRKDFEGQEAPILWFHAASLGEFEQGRPLMEKAREDFPSCKILLTFFSPSGYEIRKDYKGADYVYYLPLDTPANAKKFLDIVKPSVAIFIKYEFWYNYINQLHKSGIQALSISSVFRKKQFVFHPLGFFFRKMLKKVSHFFVQNESSEALLKSIGVSQVTVSGDTRLDRVKKIADNIQPNQAIEQFKQDKLALIIGSSWPVDINFLVEELNLLIDEIKLIVAPHNINDTELDQIESQFKGSKVRYSNLNTESTNSDILIIDNIGMLSQIYQYADIAYIGGGFRGALHNTLEAAVFGIPIFFGKHENNKKFQESIDLLQNGGAIEVSNQSQLKAILNGLLTDETIRKERGDMNKQYIMDNAGATDIILKYLKEKLAI